MTKLISNIDIAKHFGYLVGLGCSSVFYMLMDQAFDVPDSKDQITILHPLNCLAVGDNNSCPK